MRKLIKISGFVLLFLALLLASTFLYLIVVTNVKPPTTKNSASLNLKRVQIDTNCYVIGNNWLRKSNSGLWEMYVEGKPYERGVINGLLATELIHEQEAAFSDQINKLVPSSFYRRFLKYFIGYYRFCNF